MFCYLFRQLRGYLVWVFFFLLRFSEWKMKVAQGELIQWSCKRDSRLIISVCLDNLLGLETFCLSRSHYLISFVLNWKCNDGPITVVKQNYAEFFTNRIFKHQILWIHLLHELNETIVLSCSRCLRMHTMSSASNKMYWNDGRETNSGWT